MQYNATHNTILWVKWCTTCRSRHWFTLICYLYAHKLQTAKVVWIYELDWQ